MGAVVACCAVDAAVSPRVPVKFPAGSVIASMALLACRLRYPWIPVGIPHCRDAAMARSGLTGGDIPQVPHPPDPGPQTLGDFSRVAGIARGILSAIDAIMPTVHCQRNGFDAGETRCTQGIAGVARCA